MKRALFVLLSVLVILAMPLSSVLAAATTKSLSTNFTLVNLGDTDAEIDIEYFLEDGTAWPNVAAGYTHNDALGSGQNWQIRQYFDDWGGDAGAGSARVSSSAKLGAVVQIQARNQTATTGAYVGAAAGSDMFYIPLVGHRANTMSGVANSQIIIQNAGSGTVDVEVVFTPNTGFTKTYTKTIPDIAEGASYYYDIEEELNLENSATETAWLGSAVVEATTEGGSIVVVSNLFFGSNGMQTFNAFSADTLTTKWIVPIFTSKLANGLSTVVTVQNLSGAQMAAGSVELSCTADATSTPATFSKTNGTAIADKQGYSFNPPNSVPDAYADAWAGSCTLEAPADVIVYVQMRYLGRPFDNLAAYEAIPANGTATTLVVPLVAKMLGNGFATVANIANLSSETNHVKLTYVPSPTECTTAIAGCDKNGDSTIDEEDAYVIESVEIAGEGGNQRNHRIASGNSSEPTLPVGWIGSLTIQSLDDLPIGGIVQLTNTVTGTGDTLMAHSMMEKALSE